MGALGPPSIYRYPRRMHKPETWISTEIQLSLHYLANPSPDLNAEDPKKRETLLPTPISSQIRQVPTPIPNPPKIQGQYFSKTRAGGHQFIFHTSLTVFLLGPGMPLTRCALKKECHCFEFRWEISRYVRLAAKNHFQPNQIGEIRIGAFQAGKQKNVVIFGEQEPGRAIHFPDLHDRFFYWVLACP